jgi:hypothetical protein
LSVSITVEHLAIIVIGHCVRVLQYNSSVMQLAVYGIHSRFDRSATCSAVKESHFFLDNSPASLIKKDEIDVKILQLN